MNKDLFVSGNPEKLTLVRQPVLTESRVLAGRYHVRRLVGRGEVADLYLADDLFLERIVAIKILHQEAVDDPALLERFRRSAIAFAALRSPHLVNMLDFGCGSEGAYVVMQHVEGETIDHEVARAGPLSKPCAEQVLSQVVAGLAEMHRRGIAHGHVHSSNILLDRRGDVLLLDRGVAGGSRRAPTSPLPETDDAHDDFSLDVFHVGVLLIFILTGVDFGHWKQRANDEVLARVPEPFAALARRALARDPHDRYSSAVVMNAAVKAALRAPRLPNRREALPEP